VNKIFLKLKEGFQHETPKNHGNVCGLRNRRFRVYADRKRKSVNLLVYQASKNRMYPLRKSFGGECVYRNRELHPTRRANPLLLDFRMRGDILSDPAVRAFVYPFPKRRNQKLCQNRFVRRVERRDIVNVSALYVQNRKHGELYFKRMAIARSRSH
jgi:hypothetical protein